MSREERKMAQIIASIERMEQETRDDSGRSQEPQDAAKRSKKGKKGKYSGIKAKGGKKFKVASVAIGPGGAKVPFERKLTPKKRWIQLWSAQLDTVKEDGSSSSEGPAENEEDFTEMMNKQEDANLSAVASSPVSQAKVTPVASPSSTTVVEKKETMKIQEKPVVAPVTVSTKQKVEKETPALAPVAVLQTKPQEQVTEKQTAEIPKTVTTPKLTTPKATTSKVTTPNPKAAKVSSSELRVKTPLNNESSHLSPPLERNSPTTTASISPSAKVKDNDTTNNNTAAAKFSPASTEHEKPIVTERKELSRKDSAPQLERKISSSSSSSMGKSDDSNRRDTPGRPHDRGRKRSLEQCELPMSEEAKRRAERRRKRKSNWDVGDPRRGGSPITDPPVSAAAAAANQQSFAKYPPNRPSWRHSQSMMDIKPHFQSVHRSSSFYNSGSSSGSRRGFYHSTSLPQDRSRSAGRSSTRYNFGNSSSSGGGGNGSSYR
eukprot:jgi/Phyca11/505215/fgenesh2_kg.PHYCAscaffold_12_\